MVNSFFKYILPLTAFFIFNNKILQAQTMMDSSLIHSVKISESTIKTYSFKNEKSKKENGKVLIQDNSGRLEFVLNALTPIDEIISIHYGKDNRLRKFCSVVYRNGTGYYFVSASTRMQDSQWESRTVSFMRFIEINEYRTIEKVFFAVNNPKVFKVEFKGPKAEKLTFAEINGRIEQIDCHTCFYRD